MFKQLVLAIALAAGVTGTADAQSFPSKTVTIVVPFAAGGGVDLIARLIAAKLTTRWGHSVIVENRTGAGALIAAGVVAHAPADGYTLLATILETFTSNRYLYKSLPYDIDKGFAPITLLVQADQFIIANSSVPASNLKELVALVRQNKGKFSYGSWGIGSEPQLIYVLLNKHEGLDLLHVPYSGVAPVLTALIRGDVQLSVFGAFGAAGLIKAGKLKALAIAAQKRDPQFPDVPTTAESGFPYLRAAIMIGLWAPAGTPAPVIKKIGSDVRDLLKTPDLAKQINSHGFNVVGGTAEELTSLVKTESARIAEVVQAANIKPQ